MILWFVCLYVCNCVLWRSGSVYRRVPNRWDIRLETHSQSLYEWNISFSHNTQKKPNRRNFQVWNSHGQRGHAIMAIPDAAFRRFDSAYARSPSLATNSKMGQKSGVLWFILSGLWGNCTKLSYLVCLYRGMGITCPHLILGSFSPKILGPKNVVFNYAILRLFLQISADMNKVGWKTALQTVITPVHA